MTVNHLRPSIRQPVLEAAVFLEVYPQVLGISTDKRCYACGKWKPVDQFSRDRTRKDGLDPKCRACQAAYRKANAERISKTKRSCREKKIEHYRERDKRYAIENAARIDEYQRQYRVKHAEKKRAYARAYRLTDKGRMSERGASERRRARELNASGTFATSDIEAIRKAQGNRCYICGKTLKKYHIDHFIPLAKGGTNDPGNLRLACPKCNNHKRAKHPHDMGILI